MPLDFDPKNRMHKLVMRVVMIVLGVLAVICVGLIVMAPALFPGPKK